MWRFALCAVLALSAPASAQTMRGVALGAPIPEDMPNPAGSQTQHPFAYTLWNFDDGVSMSVTRDAEIGEVLYIEAWREGAVGTMSAPIDGLTFGETTRANIHTFFGSEGIVFEGRGRFSDLGPIGAHFVSYEVADSNTVVSFVTIQPIAEVSEDTADQSVLDSVIVADGTFLSQIWGINRGRLPGYSPIANPFPE